MTRQLALQCNGTTHPRFFFPASQCWLPPSLQLRFVQFFHFSPKTAGGSLFTALFLQLLLSFPYTREDNPGANRQLCQHEVLCSSYRPPGLVNASGIGLEQRG